jgi:hypothetical protein
MGWKIYFWVFTLIVVLATGFSMAESLGIVLPVEGDPSEREIWTWWDWIYLPILGISITGLFGYAYQKAIGGKSFWENFFIFFIIFDTIDIFREYNAGLYDTEVMWQPIITLSLLIAIILPYYVALFLYGFKSDALWNPQPAPPQ